MKNLFNAQKLLTVETVTKALIVQFQFIWRYNSVLSFTRIHGRTVRYHEGQQEYCSSYLVQKWQMRVDQVFLFEMPEQLNHRALQNVDDAAQAPWRPTRSCRSSMMVRVHAGICALGHTSWTGSCDALEASEVPHEWRSRCDRISVFGESDVQRNEGRIAVVGDEPHRHDWGHCCSSRFDSEWMRAPASLPHPSSADGEPTRAAEVGRSSFWTAVVCVRQMSTHHPAPHPSNVPQPTQECWLRLVRCCWCRLL